MTAIAFINYSLYSFYKLQLIMDESMWTVRFGSVRFGSERYSSSGCLNKKKDYRIRYWQTC